MHEEPLVGRETEQGLLGAAVRAVRDGGSAVVALFGEAGIGKTALLADLERQAEAAGLDLLHGRAAEHEVDVPFGPVVDALDDRVAMLGAARLQSLGEDRVRELATILPSAGEAAGAPSGPAERFRYHRTLRALIELLAREKPVALVLDDLHWADEGTIEWVDHLLRRPPKGPVLLAIALRPVGPATRLRDALRNATVLDLEPLPDSAADELLAAIPDAATRDRARAEAGGNALFLRALARAGARGGELPPTIVAAVEQETDSLPPGSRTLLEGAAVAGEPFDLELAAAAAGLDVDAGIALDQLARADLVRAGPDGRSFTFRHPLVRRAVYDAAAPGWRIGAHSRAATALAARGAPAVVQAHHVARSARHGDEAAVDILVTAAAQSSAAPGAAADWYGAALGLLPAGHPRRMELLGPRALALGSAGRIEEAHAALAETFDLLPPELVDMRVSLICGLTEIELLMGRTDDALSRVHTGLRELGDASPRARAILEVWSAMAHHAVEGHVGLSEAAQRAVATVRATDDLGHLGPALLAAAETMLGLSQFWDGEPPDEAFERAEAAWADARDEAVAEAPSIAYLVTGPMAAERFEAGLRMSRESLRMVGRTGQGQLIAPINNMLALGYIETGPLADARAAVALAEEIAYLHGVPMQAAWARSTGVTVAHLSGDPAALARARADWDGARDHIDSDLLLALTHGSVAVTLVEEDPAAARDGILAAAGERLERTDLTWRGLFGCALVRACLALGEADEAQEWARVTTELTRRHAMPMGVPRAEAATAAIELARGERAAAATRALAAAEASLRAGGRRDALAARVLAGRAQDGEEALATLRAVAADAEALGYGHFRGLAAQELRARGVRLRGAAPEARGAEGLTARELEIARLVAAGRSNREVGAALYIAPKTVEHNLSRIYAKLGVRSRTQLAAVLDPR